MVSIVTEDPRLKRGFKRILQEKAALTRKFNRAAKALGSISRIVDNRLGQTQDPAEQDVLFRIQEQAERGLQDNERR